MKLLVIITLFCISAVMSGCATTPKDAPPVLVPVASKFSTVPVPRSFSKVPDNTFTFDSSMLGVHLGSVSYQGRAALDQAIAFYKEQMPKYNWVLTNSIEYGNVMLTFSSQNELCMVNLNENGGLVTVDIKLAPKPQKVLEKLQ